MEAVRIILDAFPKNQTTFVLSSLCVLERVLKFYSILFTSSCSAISMAVFRLMHALAHDHTSSANHDTEIHALVAMIEESEKNGFVIEEKPNPS